MLRSTIANWTAFLVSAVVSFFLAPLVVHSLGNSAYGIWVMLASLVGYLGLLDLGVRGAVTRFVAASDAVSDQHQASAYVTAALRIFSVLGGAALALAVALSLLVDRLFNIPPPLLPEARAVILIGGMTVAGSFVGGVFSGVVAGLQRFDLDSTVEVALTLARAGAIVLALGAGHGLVALALIQLGIAGLRGMVAFAIVRRLRPQLSFRASGRLAPVVRSLLAFSLFSSVMHASGVVIYHTDALVIGAVLPIGVVTFYAIAGSLADYARQLVAAIGRVITARASALEATGGSRGVGELILSNGGWATFVTAPIAITFLLRGRRFIELWMGPEYAPQAAPVLCLLAITVWFAGGRSIIVATVMGINRHKGLGPAYVGEAVMNLVLSVALVGPLGLRGVALGTVIPSVAVTLGFLPRYLRSSQIPTARLFYWVWVLPSAACLPFGVATYLVERWIGASSLAGFLAQTFALVPLVGAGALGFALASTRRGIRWAPLWTPTTDVQAAQGDRTA